MQGRQVAPSQICSPSVGLLAKGLPTCWRVSRISGHPLSSLQSKIKLLKLELTMKGVVLVRVAQVEASEARLQSSEACRGEVRAVLFDMDGVLCNSEDLSRR